jgi:FAD/FMN-containing dehydrogenase/Fe-S oxidoreductase
MNTNGIRTDKYAEPEGASKVKASSLARKLKKRIEGEVRFDNGSRALYATDGSNYHQVPIGVVVPKTVDDVVETVALCREFGAPILSRGGGTSLAGQCCNVAVVMDMSKYLNQILEISQSGMYARVRPGVVLDQLRKQAISEYGLTWGPDPSTHNHCTLGGMLGNNSCGVHSIMAQFHGGGARTSDNVEELEILTYDGLRLRVGQTSDSELAQIISAGGRRGEIYAGMKKLRDTYADLIRARYPDIPRRVSGYNLDDLLPEKGFNVARALVGSESTLVTILEAKLRLLKNPKARSLLVLGYPDVYEAGAHVMDILQYQPIGLEGLDDMLVDYMITTGIHTKHLDMLPSGKGWLLVEFGGDSKGESDARARELMSALKHAEHAPSMKLFDNSDEEEHLWKIRESGLGATAFIPHHRDTWEGWEDSAVPPECVSDYLHDLRALFKKFGYEASLYGHFGNGCIHCRIPFDLITAEGVQNYLKFGDEAADLVLKYGGSISGEHGDGQSRGELLPKMFGPEICRAFVEFKKLWDPEWKMNPGKVVKPWGRAVNLRLGTEYHPWEPETHFKFPLDSQSFSRAALRCVGIGEGRREEGSTMCPSYRVLHEEKHATRGRAHLLFEMLRGETIRDGWRSKEVKESLDLCLSCKGCKGDCPVKVDMATYKAEFLSHYYKHRIRPAHAYAFGLIHVWARFASIAPRLANFFSQNAPFSTVMKFLIGVAPERKLPAFAPETFKHWFEKRGTVNEGRPPVLLFADTFNNFFHPQVSRAAVEVLEDAGFRVIVPKENLCCGRPLYDYGMLDTAGRWLQQILGQLRDEIRSGTPMVVLEPSCCAVFRDELTGLFPHDQDADRLHRQTYLISEFLEKYAPEYPPNELRDKKALVHMHCHHRAIMKLDAENKMLKRLALDVETPESGCCGMSGAFGFEKGEHYDVSIKCGERNLLPAVRKADSEKLIIASGFSCHEQIVQQTDRQPLHIAEILHLAMTEGTPRPPEPEKKQKSKQEKPADEEHQHQIETGERIVAGAGALLAGIGAYLFSHKKKHDDE